MFSITGLQIRQSFKGNTLARMNSIKLLTCEYVKCLKYGFTASKMPTFIFFVRFLVFLGILELCGTLHHDPAWRHGGRRNYNNLLGYFDAFNDMGSVQIKVPGKHYVMSGNRIFLEGPFKNSDPELTTSTSNDVQTNYSAETFPDLIGLDTIRNLTWDDDDAVEFLADLKVLSLETSRLFNLSSNTFRWLSNIDVQLLNMRYTDIEIVAEAKSQLSGRSERPVRYIFRLFHIILDTLEPVQNSLMVLDLAYANTSITDLNAMMHGLRNDTIEGRSILVVLSLAGLGLNSIPYKALTFVQHSLRALSLFGNNFRTQFTIMREEYTSADNEENEFNFTEESETNYYNSLLAKPDTSRASPWGSFPEMPFLVQLDLRQCNINYVERGSFTNLTNLKKLFISGNHILILRSYAFEGLMNLVVLDMSLNVHDASDVRSRGLIITSNSFAELHSLQAMNLSYTSIRPSSIPQLRRLPRSLITLNLRGSRLANLDGGIFSDLKNLQILDISNNKGLASDLTTETFKGLDMLQELHMAKTSLSSFAPLQELSSLRFLNVQNNNIASFEDMIGKLPLLEYLDVGFNYISNWRKGRAFATNSKLKTVYLHSNVLSLMSEDMLEDFKSLSHLRLADNAFVCNCQLKEFMEYLTDTNNDTYQKLGILVDYESTGMTYVCTDPTLSKYFGFSDTDKFCVVDSRLYWISVMQHVIYITLLVIICSLSVGGLIYWKWWYIRYVAILLKNATVLSMINVENCEDRIYLYDIFVSYADQDRNWVIEELIPNIEGPEARFSICLHERDFQVGVSILDNIIIGMDDSRTILLIISGCFLKSQWCQFEMHLAQHRLLETCREELVLVLLEEIPRRNRTKILQYLMMVKTYIVWPKDSNDVTAKALFWKRLRRAITANKSKHTSSSVA